MIETIKKGAISLFCNVCPKSKAKKISTKGSLALSDLSSGDKATIVSIGAGVELIDQLMGMGVFVGTQIEVLQSGRSRRKPVLLSVGESRIVIGQELAKVVGVERNE